MFRNVLVPLDHSATAEGALHPAADIARALGAHIDIALVHEQPVLAGLRRSAWNAEQAANEERYLAHIVNVLTTTELVPASYALLEGDVIDALCDRAASVSAGLIVMTSHGRTGFNRARLGSVADGIIRKSTVPVLMIRHPDALTHPPTGAHVLDRILVPLDGSTLSHAALDPALALASCHATQVVLLHVVEPVPMFSVPAVEDIASGVAPMVPTSIQDTAATETLCAAARAELETLVEALAKTRGVRIEAHVVVATHVAAAIADYATVGNFGVIAMATRGRGASRWLIGSVADEVLQSTRSPMLFVRPASITRPRTTAADDAPGLYQLPTSAAFKGVAVEYGIHDGSSR